jgi:hypothetical protein
MGGFLPSVFDCPGREITRTGEHSAELARSDLARLGVRIYRLVMPDAIHIPALRCPANVLASMSAGSIVDPDARAKVSPTVEMHYAMGTATMAVSDLAVGPLAYRARMVVCFRGCRCQWCRESHACRAEAVRRLDAVKTRDELAGLGPLATQPETIAAFSRAVERVVAQ